MKSDQITAIGFLLSSYESDLNYFANFSHFLKGAISFEDYCLKSQGTFKNFIDEYGVARSTKGDLTSDLLNCALEWYHKGETKDVDRFAQSIKKLTHDKVATSLASKIMYLMNPVEVLPLDSRVRAALNLRTNVYADYLAEVERFKENYKSEIFQALESVMGMLFIIEGQFAGKILGLERIRENRFVDKWLWVRGGN